MKRAVTFLAAAALLCGCGGHAAPSADRSSPTPAPASGARPAPGGASPAKARLPVVPPPSDAAALARTLARAAATLEDPRAAETDVRRAALVQQLAVRRLAQAPATATDAVVRRLHRSAGDQLGSDVAAARELAQLTAAQPRLPKWRIVAPPPPRALLRDYRRAARATGVPWEYLAAIHLVETRMGRIRGASTAGAQGPMQFLPATFEQYAPGGDINDAGDSILAAARMLRANGAPGDLDGALYAYNHSDHYVRAVKAYATRMAAAPAAYRTYWHWQVLYHRVGRTFLLPEGYPRRPAEPLPGR